MTARFHHQNICCPRIKCGHNAFILAARMALLQQPNVTLLLLKAYIVAPFTAKWGDTAREQLERGWNSGWVPQRSPLCIRIFRCAWAMIVLSCVCLELGQKPSHSIIVAFVIKRVVRKHQCVKEIASHTKVVNMISFILSLKRNCQCGYHNRWDFVCLLLVVI